MFQLTAHQDDFRLNAEADTERSAGMSILIEYNLVDESGNFLVDQSGDFLVGYAYATVYPQVLHTIQDDFRLNAR